ncbi:MAG: hypothetical protein GF387_03290 [Candidatus Portnoybacteria bacterium]|nr:hypothetical protein [Candidatus Portnoybacteria bacterium]
MTKKIIFIVLVLSLLFIGGLFFYLYQFYQEELAYRDLLVERERAEESIVEEEIVDEEIEEDVFEEEEIVLDGALLDVPFIVQAPFGNWDNPIFQDACEEASLLMAFNWINGTDIGLDEAYQEIIEIARFEEINYGSFVDRSAADTAVLMEDYFGYSDVSVVYDFGIEDIKKELEAGNLVIAPMNGRAVGNPHYTTPGPERHMIVIIGYDSYDFITNDPGTQYGEGYRYGQEAFFNAIRDYKTGDHLPILDNKKAMIIIRK